MYPAEDYESAGLRFNDIRQSYEVTAKNYGLSNALNNETWNAEIANRPELLLLQHVLAYGVERDDSNPNSVWPDDKLYWPQFNDSSVGTQIVINDTFSVAEYALANVKSVHCNKALWF
ncbi:hypothetical protein JG687_00018584 [Phytophthora cactorum]|uniref:Uncharacterized protein n=1 Tax=Phytophthora cactorum TaxID=29920 RepID=A0A329SEV7_9STRA|nr:hypothetical protein Pcac1_g870 [Phytophthora cactorum]KAG2793251.1 hypothetical protein PC111_g23114 [Phytophthora cactorum]KAG2793586.1 hypothetical protein PC112_g23381 [Phytophthora cactorum]KAG2815398.1 hypothetical protein PC113_g23209 [Phytophthora cactorum]KAG2872982.1 hypothetical protein PC114_g26085 [Phytophthora cactorum]